MHNHDEDELKILNIKLMKALDDGLAKVLEEAGYNTPKYLAKKINDVGRWHQEYFDRMVESVGQFIIEILERLDLTEAPENYRPLTLGEVSLVKAEKHEGWAEYVWNVLEQNGINEKILDEHLELKEYLEENVITSTAMSTASHLWQSYSMKPRSNSEISQFFQKTYSEKFTNRATRHASQISAKMALTDANALQEAFKIGLTEGNGVYDVIASLRDHPDFNPARSRAFALTEVLTSYSEGAYLGMMESEIVDEKEWIHTGSHKNKPRPHHQALHETRVPVDGYFDVGGHLALYPRDPDLPVGERVNCHCGVEPAIDLDEFGITEEDLEQMRAEARDEIENEYTAEELEQMLIDQHMEFNPNPLPIDQIQTEVLDLTGNNSSGIIEITQEDLNHKYAYNPDTTQIKQDTDINYSGFLEFTEVDEDGSNIEAHRDYFKEDNDAFYNTDRSSDLYEDYEVETHLRSYTSTSYTTLNGYMRGDPYHVSRVKERHTEAINAITLELDNRKLRHNLITYRGVDASTINKMFEGEGVKVGDVIVESGFMSTSTLAVTAMDFAGDSDGYLIKIKAPRGSNGMDISFLSGIERESEVLFQAGSALRVDAVSEYVDEFGIKYNLIEATLIQ